MTLLIILISYEEAKKKMKKREENLKNERNPGARVLTRVEAGATGS